MLFLVRDGKVLARATLPVDSIFDLLLLDAHTALISTGNPARLYRADLAALATSGTAPEKLTTPALLAARGLAVVGEIRDRNLRRLARFADGRIAAGSSPKGNIYVFPATVATITAKAEPVLIQENRDAEVTDLLPQPNGDLYATLVFSASGGDARINLAPAKPAKEPSDAAAAAPVSFAPAERFSGRSTLVYFPAGGFPETLSARNNVAFYQLARTGDTLLVAGGELGELLGYDLSARLPLTFDGSASSQLNALAAPPPIAPPRPGDSISAPPRPSVPCASAASAISRPPNSASKSKPAPAATRSKAGAAGPRSSPPTRPILPGGRPISAAATSNCA